jgi:transcriptional regulator with XRE-family HTH domain
MVAKKTLSLFLKGLRLEADGERMSDMAKKVGVSPAYLSSVETGKRQMTDKLFDEIVKVYQLKNDQKEELKYLSDMAKSKLDVPLDKMDDQKKDVVVQFLSSVDDLSDEDLDKINLIMNKKKK